MLFGRISHTLYFKFYLFIQLFIFFLNTLSLFSFLYALRYFPFSGSLPENSSLSLKLSCSVRPSFFSSLLLLLFFSHNFPLPFFLGLNRVPSSFLCRKSAFFLYVRMSPLFCLLYSILDVETVINFTFRHPFCLAKHRPEANCGIAVAETCRTTTTSPLFSVAYFVTDCFFCLSQRNREFTPHWSRLYFPDFGHHIQSQLMPLSSVFRLTSPYPFTV